MSDMVYGDGSIYFIPPQHEETKQKIIKCHVCGQKRPVYSMDLWFYKIDCKFFCSYGCMRKYEKSKKQKKKEKREPQEYYTYNLRDTLHDEAVAFLDQQPAGTEWSAGEFWKAFSGGNDYLVQEDYNSIHSFMRGMYDWLPVRVYRRGKDDVRAYRKMKRMDDYGTIRPDEAGGDS